MPEITERSFLKYRKTKFGIELAGFCAETGMSRKDVAEATNQKYTTLMECTTGRCAGHDLIPIVRQFMADYRAKEAGDGARANGAVPV